MSCCNSALATTTSPDPRRPVQASPAVPVKIARLGAELVHEQGRRHRGRRPCRCATARRRRVLAVEVAVVARTRRPASRAGALCRASPRAARAELFPHGGGGARCATHGASIKPAPPSPSSRPPQCMDPPAELRRLRGKPHGAARPSTHLSAATCALPLVKDRSCCSPSLPLLDRLWPVFCIVNRLNKRTVELGGWGGRGRRERGEERARGDNPRACSPSWRPRNARADQGASAGHAARVGADARVPRSSQPGYRRRPSRPGACRRTSTQA